MRQVQSGNPVSAEHCGLCGKKLDYPQRIIAREFRKIQSTLRTYSSSFSFKMEVDKGRMHVHRGTCAVTVKCGLRAAGGIGYSAVYMSVQRDSGDEHECDERFESLKEVCDWLCNKI